MGPAGVLQPLASQAQNFPLGPGEPPIESGVDEQEPFPDEQNFEVEPNPSDTSPAPSFGIPLELELEADQQSFDGGLQRFIATGDVTLVVAGGRLKADRLEYDPFNRVIWARGAVRFQRGNQYLQASLLRYNLLQGEGELQDVYGVVDLVTSLVDLDPEINTTISRT